MIRAAATSTGVLLIAAFLLCGEYRNPAEFEMRSRVDTLKSIAKTGDVKSPMKIKTIWSKAKAIQSNESFSDGDDWLRGLGMDLANASGKTIVFFEVELFFPPTETDKHQPGIVWYLQYGHNPFHYASDK